MRRSPTAARTRYGFFHIGRLRPGATVEQVQAQLDALHARNVKRFPQFRYAELGMYTAVTPLQEALTRGVRRILYLLWGGAGFVLLIGAINIANLSLARASARRASWPRGWRSGRGRFQVDAATDHRRRACRPRSAAWLAARASARRSCAALASSRRGEPAQCRRVRMDTTTFAFVAAVSVLVAC